MTYRKITLFTLFTLALTACLPLVASAGPGFGHRGPGRGLLPPAGYLDLTEEQTEAVEALRGSVREDMEGQREEGRVLRDQLKAALESNSPDATEIGHLMIELHNQREVRQAARESIESQFAALLTEEQLEKWENFKELRSSRRPPRQERGFGEDGRRAPEHF